MKQNHTFSGFTFSFVLHAALLSLALALARLVPESEIPIVIDFSITHAAPKAASMVSKNAVNRMVARKPPVQPPKKRPSKPIRPKTAKIKKKKTLKPAKPAPEEIKAIKKETAEPPQKIAAEVKEEPDPSLPEPMSADSQMDDRSPEAQAAADGPEPMAGEAGPAAGGPMDPRARYIRAHFEYIKNTIQKKIIYPVVARKKGWQGKVVVSFVVDKEGNIMDIQIRESSGFFLLDRNAVQTIKKLGPFPPPPIRAELIVPINYSLV